ncbi:central glycolytic genes regulator [Clostridium cavendishii DSM 21758]|uniref:Central glycolytic genes regulator n=1 Tax=Clostridium cavendishii DSM 21758 TaxID=1121302 RepID=A0A1M6MMZ6_9CLOT|nr:central glycolytic genes regulator [Clostridium cavendishii DSM 21758]
MTKGVFGLQDILKLQKLIVPEMVDLLEKRYIILRTIYYNQPVGRRVLANMLGLGERIVRTEINFLKTQELIEINTPGMSVTNNGEVVLEKLKEFIHEIKGLSETEEQIRKALGMRKVIIVPGNVSEDANILNELGKAAANYAKAIIKNKDIVALTGGSTIKEVVDSFPKVSGLNDILVVPARGGMGRKVETQANTLAARLAEKLNGNYKLLHVPENLNWQVLETLTKEDEIREVVATIHKANILIYGIGRADNMARKRGLSKAQQEELLRLGAVGEAFGCYFDKNSNVVSVSPTLGINLNDISKISTHIAVAGGADKVDAILATELNREQGVLITDEGAAMEIIKFLNLDA